MTKKKSSAPNQVQLIQQLTREIELSGYEFLNDDEKVNKTVLLEGEWNARVDPFLNQHIRNDKLYHDYTRAILARLYRAHLPKKVYDWHTKVLKDPAAPKSSKEETVTKLRKALGNTTVRR